MNKPIARTKKAIGYQSLTKLMPKLSIKGLSKKEFKTYQGLLSLKKATVLGLANVIRINRATLYRLLEKLIKKGLVSEIYEGKKRFFIAEDPNKLIRYINEQKQKITDILPNLKNIESKAAERPKIKFYEGKEGIKTLYNEILKERKEIVGFSLPDKLLRVIEYHPTFVKKRVKLKIPIRLILPDTKVGRIRQKLGKVDLREVKLIKEFKPSESMFLITGKKVVTFSLRHWYVGVLIENKEIAEGLKAFFEAFWTRLR